MSNRLSQLEAMHAAEPDDCFVTYALAQEYAKLDQHDEAVRWYDKTLTLNPDELYAYFHKARSLGELGEDDAAAAALELGLKRAQALGDSKAADEIEALLDMYS